jgi:hypothetical protein
VAARASKKARRNLSVITVLLGEFTGGSDMSDAGAVG